MTHNRVCPAAVSAGKGEFCTMHLLTALAMSVMGVATALAALTEALHKAPALYWLPHLAMGAVMASLHVADRILLWTGVAILAAAAVWTGIRHGGSENLRADCTDLTSCAVLLCASAARQNADGPSVSLVAHHSESGATLYAATSLTALMATLAWSVTRAILHVRGCRRAAPRPAAWMRTGRQPSLVAGTTGLVMVPLMAATVIWS